MNSANPNQFENYRLSNNFGSYHSYSRLENSNYFIVAMSEVSDPGQAGTTPNKFFRFDIRDINADPVEFTTNRAIKSVKFSSYVSNYIFVIFKDHSPPFTLDINPSRQVFNGLAMANNTNHVINHEYENYDINIEIEVVGDATSVPNEHTLLVLTFPNYLNRRRVSNGLEKDLKVLTGFGEHLEH